MNTVTNQPQSACPNDILAAQIVEKLIDAGIVLERNRAELESKLKRGGATQDDWNSWIDLATAPPGTEGEADE